MDIVTDLACFQRESVPHLVVALGNFDGFHLGHQAIIGALKTQARKIKGTAAVFTFREHPQRVLHTDQKPPLLTALVHKLLLLEAAGLDLCFLVDFTLPFSTVSPEAFVVDTLTGRLGAKEIWLGFNARFGSRREGDSRLMGQLAKQYGFGFFQAPCYRVDDQVVSSTVVRSLVAHGELEAAGRMLGRPYSFFGTAVKGAGRGKRLGFPTVNLDPHSEALPPEGVYAARVRVQECYLEETRPGWSCIRRSSQAAPLYGGVLNYGKRPTFGGNEAAVPEVHVFDCEEDFRGKNLEVTVGVRLRGEKKFLSENDLKAQIAIDIKQARGWLSRHSCSVSSS